MTSLMLIFCDLNETKVTQLGITSVSSNMSSPPWLQNMNQNPLPFFWRALMLSLTEVLRAPSLLYLTSHHLFVTSLCYILAIVFEE